ncbi:MAG: type II secretion system protein M [Sideroxydans sp.]|nr:type II secretion system protein M [Sideroxydans sp.]NOT97679.1 type II secretion system protein M [Sideroxydans sp.]
MKIAAQLHARWTALTASEQRMLTWGAAIVLPASFYILLWQPAHSAVAKLQRSVPQQRAALLQMQAQAVEVQTLRQGTHLAVVEGDALRQLVNVAVEGAGWAAPNVTVELAEKNEVRISAESLEFARWMKFLHELETTHHLRASSLTVSVLPTAGMVKVNAVVSNGAAN